MTLTRRDVLAGTAALVVAPTCAPVWAQSNTVTLVVPFPPGGSTDALARQLQSPLQTRLGRVVIVNSTGVSPSTWTSFHTVRATNGRLLSIPCVTCTGCTVLSAACASGVGSW